MKYSKWIGLAGVALIIVSCLIPWVVIESKNLVVTGLQTSGTNYGKPGLMNLIMSGVALILFIVPRIAAKRANIFLCAFNLGWAVRNYIVVSACYAGECPVKQAGIYLLMIAAVMMLAAAVLPDLKLEE